MITGSIKFFPQCRRQYCLLFLKWILPRSLNFFDLIGMRGIYAAKWTKNANSKYKTFTLLNQHRTALNAVYTNVHIVTYFTLIFFHSSIVKCMWLCFFTFDFRLFRPHRRINGCWQKAWFSLWWLKMSLWYVSTKSIQFFPPITLCTL